ncbi:MAG: hypothetical protein V7725_04475 [Porticoccus sp.]
MIRTLQLVVLVLWGLSGCMSSAPSEPEQSYAKKLRSSSSVVVSKPGFYLPKGEPVGWYSDVVWVDPQKILSNKPSLPNHLRSEVQRQMSNKGHMFINTNSAEYVMLAAIILGDISTSESERLNKFFNIDPALNKASEDYEVGTLLLAIGKREGHRALWRGAVQVFVGEEIPESVGRQRLEQYIGTLLASVPQK